VSELGVTHGTAASDRDQWVTEIAEMFRYQKMSSQYETANPSLHFHTLCCFYPQRRMY